MTDLDLAGTKRQHAVHLGRLVVRAEVQVQSVLDLPLTSRGHTEVGWEDLIVSASVQGGGSYSRPVDETHAVSARRALRRLANDDIFLVKLPHPFPTKGGHDNLHLYQDMGPRQLDHPVPYTVPDANEKVISIPVDFFLNGWVYVLEDVEVATYLMYRRLCPYLHPEPAHISSTERKTHYGITQSAWEMYWGLEDGGLLGSRARREST